MTQSKPSIRSGGHATSRQVEADFARQIREELESLDVPEELKKEKETAARRVKMLEEEARKEALDIERRREIQRKLKEEKKFINRLKRTALDILDDIKLYGYDLATSKPGRIASKVLKVGGRVAPVAGAAMTGYEVGRAIDELSGGAISDYGSKLFDPITQRMY
jgi:hypothetical protein